MENMPTSTAKVTENVSVAPTVEEVKARIVEEVNALIAGGGVGRPRPTVTGRHFLTYFAPFISCNIFLAGS